MYMSYIRGGTFHIFHKILIHRRLPAPAVIAWEGWIQNKRCVMQTVHQADTTRQSIIWHDAEAVPFILLP